MTDRELLHQFEACTFPAEKWDHRAHLTAAYQYLRDHFPDDAIDHMRRGIKKYNKAMNVPDSLDRGYHETMTVAWMKILHAMMQSLGAEDSAGAFLEKQSFLLNKRLLLLFYSRDLIMSERAKREWVEPDLAPLPVVNNG